MKIHRLLIMLGILILPIYTFAGWQVATKPKTIVQREPFFQTNINARKCKAVVSPNLNRPGTANIPNQYGRITRPVTVKPVTKTLVTSPSPTSSTKMPNRYAGVKRPLISLPAKPPNLSLRLRRSVVPHTTHPIHAKSPNIPPSIRPRPKVYAVTVTGSLKENVERIMGRYHWKVIWKAPYDFNFDGRVTGSSLPNVVEKLFQPFPLQAVMYMSNRTLAIVPRTTKA